MEGSILRKWANGDSFKPDKTFRNSVSLPLFLRRLVAVFVKTKT